MFWSGWKWPRGIKMSHSFSCFPMNRQCLRKKTRQKKNPSKNQSSRTFPRPLQMMLFASKNINLFMKKEVKEHNIGNWRMITAAAWKNNNDGSIGGVGMLLSTRTFKALLTVISRKWKNSIINCGAQSSFVSVQSDHRIASNS